MHGQKNIKLYLPNVIRAIETRGMVLAGHVARMGMGEVHT